ncbi:MAG: SprT family zinc-dependent metalloprotease [Gaiellaceae bacterium]
MVTQIELGDITAVLTRKNIKNIYLRVDPPAGEVRISAPRRMSLDQIRAFALSRLAWIEKQRARLRELERATPRSYLDGEIHYVWGRPYRLEVAYSNRAPSIALSAGAMLLTTRPGACTAKRQAIVEAWYREQLHRAAPPLVARWEPPLGVEVQRLFVQRMKTRWGSCNPAARTIRLNSELARRSPEYLEYVLVHELVHLLEASHGTHFRALMDRFLPDWRERREGLKRFP